MIVFDSCTFFLSCFEGYAETDNECPICAPENRCVFSLSATFCSLTLIFDFFSSLLCALFLILKDKMKMRFLIQLKDLRHVLPFVQSLA